MIFDAHGDILTDVMIELGKGIDIWNDYHLPMYKKANIKQTVLINFTDPFADNQKQEYKKINDIALPYFKENKSVNVLNDNDFDLEKVNIIFGIEGLGALENMNDVKEARELGYKLYGLTWNETNNFAAGADSLNGLTTLGEELIRFLDENNCIIDLAHASKKTFLDVANLTKNPLFVSHSGCASILDIVRNVDDKQLEMIRKSSGVVGIYNIDAFLAKDPKEATVQTLCDHIDHVVNTIGIDHVGLGLDFCYYLGDHDGDQGTQGLKRISDTNNILVELKERGYSDSDIEKVAFTNMKRVTDIILKI